MSLDDRLTAWGAAERAAAGDPPPLEVPAVRRRWAPLAAAAAAVLVAGGAVLLVGHNKAPAPETPTAPQRHVVPWAPLAPQGQHPGALPQATADPSVRACTASDLRGAHSGEAEGSGGNLFDAFVLTNASSTPCRLEGRVQSLHTGSDVWPATEGQVQEVVAKVLGTGESVPLDFSVYTRCDDGGPGRTYGSMSLEALGGRIAIPGTLDLGCARPQDGIGFAGLGEVAPEPSYAPDPVADLVPSLELPATVKAGETLRYTVTLSNPTTTDIALDLCPDFLQTMTGVKQTYLLNCPQADPVPAGGSEVFAMELVVPADLNGPTQVSWFLERGLQQIADGTVEVR